MSCKSVLATINSEAKSIEITCELEENHFKDTGLIHCGRFEKEIYKWGTVEDGSIGEEAPEKPVDVADVDQIKSLDARITALESI